MCLIINTKKRRPSKPFKIYKIFRIGRNKLVTPYQRVSIKEGVFKAKGIPGDTEIWGGAIHAYQNKKVMEENLNEDKVCLVCTVDPKDFIAWGENGDVAVKRITIPKGFIKKSIAEKQLSLIKKEILYIIDDIDMLYDNCKYNKEFIKKVRTLCS